MGGGVASFLVGTQALVRDTTIVGSSHPRSVGAGLSRQCGGVSVAYGAEADVVDIRVDPEGRLWFQVQPEAGGEPRWCDAGSLKAHSADPVTSRKRPKPADFGDFEGESEKAKKPAAAAKAPAAPEEVEEAAEEAEAPAPKKRGRKKAPAAPEEEAAEAPPPKKRGRPPKAAKAAAPAKKPAAAKAPAAAEPEEREQVRTAGGRVATILERRARGWLFVELDGDANDEGGAGERKSLRANTTTPLDAAEPADEAPADAPAPADAE